MKFKWMISIWSGANKIRIQSQNILNNQWRQLWGKQFLTVLWKGSKKSGIMPDKKHFSKYDHIQNTNYSQRGKAGVLISKWRWNKMQITIQTLGDGWSLSQERALCHELQVG